MIRSFCVIAGILLAYGALAAPAPDPLKSWGKPVDPDEDCKIRRNGGILSIEMPGSYHDYDPIRKRFNSPRILREIKGEFDFQVRVRIDSRPSAQSTDKGQPSYVAAGFLLLLPDTTRPTCSRLDYGILAGGTGLDAYTVAPLLSYPQIAETSRKRIGTDGYVAEKTWYYKGLVGGVPWDRLPENSRVLEQFYQLFDHGWKKWPLPNKAGQAYLRLEQRSQWIYFLISPDGDKWSVVVARANLPTNLKVGMAAYTTSSERSTVLFDQLEFTQGGNKKKRRDEREFWRH
jgi:hypothetical protein